jgi:tRNA(Met) cytidine acetyltransferase
MKPRQCIVVLGDRPWCLSTSEQLLASVSATQICHLTAQPSSFKQPLEPQKAKSILGQEFDAIVFDGLDGVNADSLGLCLGTIRAGGALILWLNTEANNGLWLSRFLAITEQYQQRSDDFKLIRQGDALPELTIDFGAFQTYQTCEQQDAIKAIKHVVYGHRKRPLVLSADRGRGKSAALGLAAAELIIEGKQCILLTAPSLAAVEVCFEHAHRQLTGSVYSKGLISIGSAQIKFIAPDALLEEKPEAALLLVDEAAAIPVAMLSQITEHYSRVVFASTIHGYEGTGRGFSIRFQSELDKTMPGWHSLVLTTPIRWAENDLLEQFGFDALLLNASPVAEEQINKATLQNCVVENVDRRSLIGNETDLRELFGLMVLAHYRTRPSDLQMMLDRDDIHLYVIRAVGHIVATSWVVDEGPIDETLADQIYLGNRRIKGELLPQALLNHVGITSAGGLRFRRVMRIAVHPALLRQHFAARLLEKIRLDAQEDKIDVLGASFSASSDLVEFWLKTGFQFCHIGVQRDHVSSAYTVMVLQSLSSEGAVIIDHCQNSLSKYWSDYLLTRYQYLEPKLALLLTQIISPDKMTLDASDITSVESFVYGQRGYEFCQFAIRNHLIAEINQSCFRRLGAFEQQLLVMFVLQNQSPADVIKSLKLSSRASLIQQLKTALQQFLELKTS